MIEVIEYLLEWGGFTAWTQFGYMMQEVTPARRRYRVEHHAALLGATLALAPLGLPPYVHLWILDWAIDGPLGLHRRIGLLEGVARSRLKLRGGPPGGGD